MKTKGMRIQFNVGGKMFETSSMTLAIAGPNSFFAPLLDENWNLRSDTDADPDVKVVHIDRNPDCFGVLLDLLRTGELHLPTNILKSSLYREAQFYGLVDHVRAAMCGPFDGNRLSLSDSIISRKIGTATAIRASPNGGCCIAYDRLVHIYDWMLREHRPINLGYRKIKDIGWSDSENIIVTTSKGMALFDSSTGELKHNFCVRHKNKSAKFMAGALCLNSGQKIFSCSRRTFNADSYGPDNGIGVWDRTTGEPVDFFYDCDKVVSKAIKLQWIQGKNSLLVATHAKKLRLVDFRSKKIVWSWSSIQSGIKDVAAMEDGNSIAVADNWNKLGFYDFRHGRKFWWFRDNGSDEHDGSDKHDHKIEKVTTYLDQVFTFHNDHISVYSGPKHTLTSQLRLSDRGFIQDFSINKDRLFTLDKNNIVDVWETPKLPIF